MPGSVGKNCGEKGFFKPAWRLPGNRMSTMSGRHEAPSRNKYARHTGSSNTSSLRSQCARARVWGENGVACQFDQFNQSFVRLGGASDELKLSISSRVVAGDSLDSPDSHSRPAHGGCAEQQRVQEACVYVDGGHHLSRPSETRERLERQRLRPRGPAAGPAPPLLPPSHEQPGPVPPRPRADADVDAEAISGYSGGDGAAPLRLSGRPGPSESPARPR